MQHLNKTLRGTKKFYKYKKLLINEKARRLEKQIKRECPFKTKKEELKNKRYQKKVENSPYKKNIGSICL